MFVVDGEAGLQRLELTRVLAIEVEAHEIPTVAVGDGDVSPASVGDEAGDGRQVAVVAIEKERAAQLPISADVECWDEIARECVEGCVFLLAEDDAAGAGLEPQLEAEGRVPGLAGGRIRKNVIRQRDVTRAAIEGETLACQAWLRK